MSITQSLLKFIAARFNIPGDALDYFFTSANIGRSAETILPFPAELIAIGARLAMRGWMNNKFFPTNRDWVLPYWAERQFDPSQPAFMPRGLNLYTINYTHRDWTMIGTLGAQRKREAIVDPRGLVTPWFDGWSLDVWLGIDGKLFAPSRLADSHVEQSLHENLPIVVTTFRAGDVRVRLETFATEQYEQGFVVEQIAVENQTRTPQSATLYLSVRPLNPEGVGLVKDISFRPCHAERSEASPNAESETLREVHADQGSTHSDIAILVNQALGVILPKPDAVACSNYDDGDVALALPNLNGKTSVHCKAGLATAVAAYRIELGAGESRTLSVFMPMERKKIEEDESPNYKLQITNYNSLDFRSQVITNWRDQLARGMRVRLPDEQLQNAFDANKAFLLLLHDGDTITPGPWTYHQFWFRDAAYMLNALDKLGYHDESRQVIEKFGRRLQKDGYMQATEGEWDSNGAAIWSMVEHARLSGDRDWLVAKYWSLLRMASWINSKRQKTKDKRQKSDRSLHHGLLPPGPSAEHLGPSDYFYWDDFWSLAGLRDATRIAEWFKQTEDTKKLAQNFESFRADVDTSLELVAQRIGRAAMPASPYRRLDAGMIGNLVALYPLRLFDANDPRIVDTIAALKDVAWMEDAYFNHVGHSALGTYLSLHVAECLLFQRNPDAWKIFNWVLQHASPTFTWAEGLNPITRRGGMGDGHHGWALADFLLMVRNLLLFEENDHLVLTPLLPEDWTTEMNVIKVEDAPTYFGKLNFTIAFGERTGTIVVDGKWRDDALKYIEWNLPFPLREAGADTTAGNVTIVGNTVRIPRDVRRVVVIW
ncbi:MAG: hypothetical protein HZB51_20435 [Chloroflexi bacterium]|nr:hypothetical protein [Chloroflexota bacterium]